MNKIISFSLWGNDPKYCVGALRNADIAQTLFPDWQCWFFCRSDVDKETESKLLKLPNVAIVAVNEPGNWMGMFDRFKVATYSDCEAMISRDCDSRLSLREKAAVDEWLASDKTFHIMRDHPWHGSQILGGMWGCKQGFLPEFGDLMKDWHKENRWQTDQDFLNAAVYPRVVHNAMIHASFFRMEPHAKDFPTPRDGVSFVGQVFDENENTIAEHLAALAKAL